MIKDIIKKNRSCRRFKKGVKINKKTLTELVELTRLSASAANLQPLKYLLSYTPEKNKMIFPNTKWAGYLRDWNGPTEDERPSAYILILGDTEITKSFGCDHGIAAQSILLGAVEKGLRGCILGALNRQGLHKSLGIPSRYEILLAIALGKPAEKSVIETVRDGDIKYWRDKKDVLHVPKRPLEELILDL
jgi:nitroreductase